MIEEQKRLLAADCTSLENSANDALGWLSDAQTRYPAVQDKARSLHRELQRLQTSAHRLGEAAGRRMCVGIYGPSRAGKSFLVNSLAKGSNKNFAVMIGSHKIDFLDAINPIPSDSKEGTGVVTRFTAHPRRAPDDHPIFLRILSELDIVKILINTSQKDIKHDIENPVFQIQSSDEIYKILDDLGARATGGKDGPDERAMFDLREHILSKYKGRFKSINGSQYWSRAAKLAGQLSLEDRATLFGVLWGGQEDFTKLFLDVASAAEAIGWCTEAACQISALVEQSANGFKRNESIICVESLKRLGDEVTEQVEIVPLNGEKKGVPVPLPKSLVTALIAELELRLGDTGHDFFETADVLDFPGLRERIPQESFYVKSDDGQHDENRPAHFFLRGKVDYLFQRYEAEREMTALFAVLDVGRLDLIEMCDMVNDWLNHSLGDTPEARKQHPNTLFFVFNKFDMHLADVGGGENDVSLRGRFNGRIADGLLKLWSNDGWPSNWDGKAFQNCFWMRNTAMPCGAIDRDENDQEIGTSEARRDHVDTLRKLCLDDSLVNDHMRDPARAFDAAIAPNDGGVSYLVETLTEVCTPDLKINLIRKRLEEEKHRFVRTLEGFYDDAGGDSREKKRKEAAKIANVLLKGCVRKRRFAALLNIFQLPMDEIASIHGRPRIDDDEEVDDVGLIPDVSDDPDDLLQDLFGADDEGDDNNAPVAAVAPQVEGRSYLFAKDVVQQWFDYLNRLPSDEAVLHYFLIDEESLGNLVLILTKGAERINLRNSIAQHVRQETEGAGTNWNDVGRRVVYITHRHIADYVIWLGFAGVPRDSRPTIPKSDPEIVVFDDPTPQGDGLPVLPAELPSYAQGRSDYEKHWLVALMELTAANAGFIGGGILNAEDNDHLGVILKGSGSATSGESEGA